MEKEFIEIPLGAKDSELGGWEYNIPKGYTASIENGKIIVKKEEGEDEKIRKEIIEYIKTGTYHKSWIAWLEKQGEQKPVDFKAKDWYVSKVDGKIHNMTYNPTDKVEPNPTWSEEDTFKVQRICKYLDEAKKYYADITEVRECIDWLKSLKERLKGE